MVDRATPICFFGGAAWTEVVCFVRSRCAAAVDAQILSAFCDYVH